jgi:rRNA-processing protein FCF1
MKSKIQKIIPDTNFLIYLARFKLFDEFYALGYKIIVPRIVDYELEKMSKNQETKQEDKQAALLAQQVVKRWVELKKAEYVDVQGDYADDIILKLALKSKCFVATMDQELQKKLKAQGTRVIGIRQEKILEEI